MWRVRGWAKALTGVALCATLATGCDEEASPSTGGGSGDAGGSGGGGVGAPAAKPSDVDNVDAMIGAADGGEVRTQGVVIDIGAGALDDDTTVTITPISESDVPPHLLKDAASILYDFGPDGTRFNEPVEITIAFDAASTPAGKQAVVAWVDTYVPEWVVLDDSKVNGDSVTATTDHFTPFAVIFRDAEAGGTGGGEADSGSGTVGQPDAGGGGGGTVKGGCPTDLSDDSGCFEVDGEQYSTGAGNAFVGQGSAADQVWVSLSKDGVEPPTMIIKFAIDTDASTGTVECDSAPTTISLNTGDATYGAEPALAALGSSCSISLDEFGSNVGDTVAGSFSGEFYSSGGNQSGTGTFRAVVAY